MSSNELVRSERCCWPRVSADRGPLEADSCQMGALQRRPRMDAMDKLQGCKGLDHRIDM
jgi:hypothetical protein